MKVYVITGANKGIGKGLASMLLETYSSEKIDIKIILTGRDKFKLENTVEDLSKISPKYRSMLDSYPLDITNISQIINFKSFVKQKYGSISVLMNNAGIKNKSVLKSKEEIFDDVVNTFKTNVFGHKILTENLLDLIVKSPKELNPHIMFTNGFVGFNTFTSKSLSINNKTLKENFNSITKEEEITDMYNELLIDLVENKQELWDYKYYKICFSYGLSKIFLNAYIRVLSKRLNKSNDNKNIEIMVNSFNPGWCKTDMAGDKAPMTVQEGCLNAKYMDSFGTKESKYTGLIFEKMKKIEF